MVNGSARCLNTLYVNDLNVSGTTSFASLATTGDASIGGHLTVGYSNTFQDSQISTHGVISNEWFRSVGNVGWYSQTYIGGIWMKNTYAIRTYGSRNFFVENGDFYVGTTANDPTATDAPVFYFKRDGSLYASNIKAASGRVNNLFVEDELRALHYNIQTVADLGGTFIVAPTLYCSANATFQVSAINGTTITATINDASSIDSDTLGGATWKANSQIKISGSFGGVVIGTCSGHLTANMNASAGTMKIQFTYDAQSINPLSVKTYAANEISDLHVMLTTVYDQTDNPVGIYMTSYDANKRSHISLYGGTDTKPTVRIGNLQGLDAINNVTPTGWGIYTNNGFFSGVIVSNSGKIGDFTISDALYSSTHSDYNTNVDGIYIGSDYISFGKQGVTYFKPDGTGKIGAWNVSATAFSNGTYGSDSSVYISTANMASKAIGGRTGADWRLTVGSHFGVTNTGAFYANSANVTGTINATTGTFGNGTYKITVGNGGTANSAIRYGMTALGDTTHDGFYIGTDGVALGKGKFKVTGAGALTATSASITGEITATKLTVSNNATITGLNRNRVFTEEPTPPYEKGDLWHVQEEIETYYLTLDTTIDSEKTYYTYSNDVYTAVANPTVENIGSYYERRVITKNNMFVCIITKTSSQSFDANDWAIASTDDGADEDLSIRIDESNNSIYQSINGVEANIGIIQDTLIDNETEFDNINNSFVAVNNSIDSVTENILDQQTQIANLDSKTDSTNETITSLRADIENNEISINNLIRGVVVDSEEPSVAIQLMDAAQNKLYGQIKLSVDTDGSNNSTGLINISGSSNTVSWFDNQSMYANTIYTTSIMPRSIDGNPGRADVQMTGGLALIARSNGHLSLKSIN